MTTEDNDPFRYRNEGGVINVGEEKDGPLSTMIRAGDNFIIVKRLLTNC